MKAAKKTASGAPKRGYLDGQMLIAMPSMRDERFSRSLIYVCAHSSEGAISPTGKASGRTPWRTAFVGSG